jgi:DNA-binding GntR family transcriptional regulator
MRWTARGMRWVSKMTTSPKREFVARIMRARIARGDYPDGHSLSQAQLAAEFGVTRHVIWPALATLQKEGLATLPTCGPDGDTAMSPGLRLPHDDNQ